MSDFVIACLGQKGGVGKSTIARLISRTYASADWTVKICDFNVNQLTSTDWAALRMGAGIKPEIDAQPMSSTKKLKSEPYDLLVIDGAPDSDQSSLDAARTATLIVIPTGSTVDDLKPQLGFAHELVAKGVDADRIFFVLNKTTDSALAGREALKFVRKQGFRIADTDLNAMAGYQSAQNHGFALSETKYSTLNERADALAAEIVARMNELMKKEAA